MSTLNGKGAKMFIGKSKFKELVDELVFLKKQNIRNEERISELEGRIAKSEQKIGYFNGVIDSIKSDVEELSKMLDVQGADGEKKPTINEIIDEWLNGKESV